VKFIQQLSLMIIVSFYLSGLLLAKQYTVAVRAHSGNDVSYQKWQATIDWLNKKIPEHHFEMISFVSLEEILEQTRNKEFDFLLTNPSSYVEANKFYGVNAIATLNNKRGDSAQNRFGSVIFTHARNIDIKKIPDLKNKTLMIVSESAFGGWQVSWLEMLTQDFDPYKNLKEIKVTINGTQQEVVYAVKNNLVDVGVVRTDLLERMEKKGDIDMRYLRVINNKDIAEFPFFLSTKLYPEWAFAELNHVPAVVSRKVKTALLLIPKESSAAMKGQYVGWIEPLDYLPVENLMRTLSVGPYLESKKQSVINISNGYKK